MDRNELKKVLYKENPVAFFKNLDKHGTRFYDCECSLGVIEFKIPIEEQTTESGKSVFENQMPAKLLIRWMIVPTNT